MNESHLVEWTQLMPDKEIDLKMLFIDTCRLAALFIFMYANSKAPLSNSIYHPSHYIAISVPEALINRNVALAAGVSSLTTVKHVTSLSGRK